MIALDDSAVYVRELRARQRGWWRWGNYAIAALPAVVSALLFAVSERGDIALYNIAVSIEWLLVIIIVPAQAASAFAREDEHHTLESLLATPLPTREIVIGKLLSALYPVGYAIAGGFAAALLLWCLRFPEKNLPIILAQLAVAALAFFLAALGVCCSTFFNRVAVATAVTFAMALATVGLGPITITASYAFDMWFGDAGAIAWMLLGSLLAGFFTLASTFAIAGPLAVLTCREPSREFSVTLGLAFFLFYGALVWLLPQLSGSDYEQYLLFGNPFYVIGSVYDWLWHDWMNYGEFYIEPVMLYAGLLLPPVASIGFIGGTLHRLRRRRRAL